MPRAKTPFHRKALFEPLTGRREGNMATHDISLMSLPALKAEVNRLSGEGKRRKLDQIEERALRKAQALLKVREEQEARKPRK